MPEVIAMMNEMTGLHEARLDHVCSTLKTSGARRVLDLGCGAGALLYRLLNEPAFTEVVGVEQSILRLAEARQMLQAHLVGDTPRLTLLPGSYTDRHASLVGFDAAAMVETIEHIPLPMLSQVEETVFGYFRPRVLFMTTPNREYNPLFGMAANAFREPDHKFEWDRLKFKRWASGVALRQGYRVTMGGIGDYDAEAGYPTQTALFTLGHL